MGTIVAVDDTGPVDALVGDYDVDDGARRAERRLGGVLLQGVAAQQLPELFRCRAVRLHIDVYVAGGDNWPTVPS